MFSWGQWQRRRSQLCTLAHRIHSSRPAGILTLETRLSYCKRVSVEELAENSFLKEQPSHFGGYWHLQNQMK